MNLAQLVEMFSDNHADYTKATFNETQTRIQFIDPLFQILGWDMANQSGYSEDYKEVIHSDALKDEGRSKAPDYAFRIGRERKFFVEAKKPSIDLKKDKAAAYQIRRYAWSAKLPLSILTNFRQLAVYDTRKKPNKGDSASVGLALPIIEFKDFESKIGEVAALFSKEAILRGAFDRFADEKTRKGTLPVDEDFLNTLEEWRFRLAKTVHKHNSSLGQDQLAYVVQALIDRVLFLRISEDIGLERFGTLIPTQKRGHYRELLTKFRNAQQRYNSGLFHLYPENKRDRPIDEISAGLKVPDGEIMDFIAGFYDPAPYVFSVIPPEILGSVYERFLGSQILITKGKVSIEPKPEAKKAGGVYYTPEPVVKYMVREALARARYRKAGSKPRILDMACGSGSFLIRVYQELLDWHLAEYLKSGKPSKQMQKIASASGHVEYRLTLAERRRILLDHVFGVDLDPQAVEVTKLSLFLKLINDPNVMPKQLELATFQSRILPDMSKNIRCGNSIVAPDVLEWTDLTLDELENLKPMDWAGEEGFPEIMNSGGFDVVVGNPPYAYRQATIGKFKDYYTNRYNTTEGNFDIYKMFLEQGVRLCRVGGVISQIINASFLIQPQFVKLRKFLLENLRISELSVMGPNVFKGVTLDTAIICGVKGKSTGRDMVLLKEPSTPFAVGSESGHKMPQHRFKKNSGLVFDWRVTDQTAPILDRIFASFTGLENSFDLSVGINTGAMKSEMTAPTKRNGSYHPCVPGSGLSRYGDCRTDGYIAYDRELVRKAGSRGRSLPPKSFFTSDKILLVRTRNTSIKRRIVATIDTKQKFNLNRLSNIVAKNGSDIHSLLAILNSELANFIFLTKFFNYEIKPVFLKSFPIPFASSSVLSGLAKDMLKTTFDLEQPCSPTRRSALEASQRDLERRIDEKVYDAYGLSKVEIGLVQKALAEIPGTI